jgi:hypothetical protein
MFSNRVLPVMMDSLQEKVRAQLRTARHASLTADMWEDKGQAFIVVTAHVINRELDMLSVFLDLQHFPEHHSAENIWLIVQEQLDHYFEQSPCEPSVIRAITTDTASNCRKFGDLCSFDWHPCLAHVIHLVAKDCFAPAQALLVTIRRLVSMFRDIKEMRFLLTQAQRESKNPRTALTLDIATRWNSTYDMLCALISVSGNL